MTAISRKRSFAKNHAAANPDWSAATAGRQPAPQVFATVSWKYNLNGLWSNASYWSGGALPGTSNNVLLDTVGSHTVTFASGTGTIQALTADTDTLSVTGGTLSALGTATLDAGLSLSGGKLNLLGTSGLVAGAFNLSDTGPSGSAAPTLSLAGTTTLSSTGTLNVTGAYTINASAVEIDGGALLTSGVTNIADTAASGYVQDLALGGGIAWKNTGTVNVSGGITIGDSAGGSASILNAAGAVFDLTANNFIDEPSGASTGVFTNAGTLEKTGGTGISLIDIAFSNTGVVDAAIGEIAFGGGGSFAGTLTGAGTIGFESNLVTLASTSVFSAANLDVEGATLSVPYSLALPGALTMQYNVLNLNGATNSFGAFSSVGRGTITIAGNAAFNGGLSLEAGFGSLAVLGSSMVVNGTFNYGEGIASSQNISVITLGTKSTLSVTGTANIVGYSKFAYLTTGPEPQIDGGNFVTAGQVNISNPNNLDDPGLILGGGVVWTNTGTVSINDASIQIGDANANVNAGGFTASFVNAASGVFNLGGPYDGFSYDNGILNDADGYYGDTASFANAGTFEKTGGNTFTDIAATFTNTGLIDVGSGLYLDFSRGGSFGGTLTGAGVIDFGNDAATLTAASVFSAANLLVEGTLTASNALTLTGFVADEDGVLNLNSTGTEMFAGGYTQIGGDVTIAGNAVIGNGFTMYDTNGTLSLLGSSNTVSGIFTDGDTYGAGQILLGTASVLSLTGAANFTGDTPTTYSLTAPEIDSGTLVTASAVSIVQLGPQGDLGLTLGGGILWRNTGIVSDGNATIDAGDAIGATAAIVNVAGASFDFVSDNNGIVDSAGGDSATFSNAGTFAKTGGTLTTSIYAVFTNTGVIDAAAGTLEFDGGGSFGGTITGGAQIAFGGGTSTITGGNVFTAANLLLDGGTLTDPNALSLSGGLTASGGTLTLGGALTDPGSFSVTGNALINLDGAANTIGTYTQSGAFTEATLLGNGTFTGAVSLMGGYLDVQGNATFDAGVTLAHGAALILGNGGSTTATVAGTFTETLAAGDYAYVAMGPGATLSLTGTVNIASGAPVGAGNAAAALFEFGTLVTSAVTTIGETASPGNLGAIFSDGITWINTGSVNVTNAMIGYGYAPGTSAGPGANFINAYGAQFNFTSDSTGIVAWNSSSDSASFTNAGTFTKIGGTGTIAIDPFFTNTGTISVASGAGTIAFAGGGTFAGTLNGGGTVVFASGQGFFLGNLNTVANTTLLASGAYLTLDGNASIAGAFTDTSGQVGLAAGDTLTLASASLFGGTDANNTYGQTYLSGPGTLATTGITTILDYNINYAQIQFAGGAIWSNAGTVNDAGVTELGDYSGAGTLINQAGASFDFDTDDGQILNGGTLGSVVNAGTLAKLGGTATSNVYASITNTGTLQTTTGTLALQDGGSLAGSIAESSDIVLGGGSFADAGLAIGGGALVTNAATVTQSGTLTLGDTAAKAANFVNDGTYMLSAGASLIATSAAADLFTNAAGALLEQVAGTGRSLVSAAIANSGTILAASGTLALTGTLSGTGALTIGAGATLELGSNIGTGQTVSYLATSGTLALDSASAMKAGIAGFTVGDTIDLLNTSATSATLSSAGSLVVYNGTSAIATLSLTGTHTGDTYSFKSDGHGGTLLGIASKLSTWNGSSADWDTPGDWNQGVPDGQTNATASGSTGYQLTLARGETAYANNLTLSDAKATYSLTGTLDLAHTLSLAAGTLYLGGVLNGGTLTTTGGTFYYDGESTQNVDFVGSLNLTQFDSSLNVQTPLIQSGSGDGTINLTGQGATLSLAGFQTPAFTTLNIGNANGPAELASTDPAGQGALIALDCAINQVGTYAALADAGGTSDGIFSVGTLTAGISGGTFSITGNQFENDGVINLSNTDYLDIQAAAVNTGSIASTNGTLELNDLQNTGTIVVTGGTLTLDGSLQNTGSITTTNTALHLNGSITTAQLGAILGSGDTLSIGSTGSLAGTGSVAVTTDGGTITASGGTLALSHSLAGSGTVSAAAGAVLLLGGGGTFDGTLGGAGTVDVSAALTLGAGASLSASMILQTATLNVVANTSVAESAGAIFDIGAASGKTVSLGSGAGARFLNAGIFEATGAGTASVSVAGFTNSGTVSSNAGTMSFLGTLTNNGLISAAGGLLSASHDVAGSGTLAVGAGGTLSLLAGAATGQMVDFLAGTGALNLTSPSAFLGSIAGFGGNDGIDLVNTPETGFAFANGVLTVTNGSTTQASLHFAGSYNVSDFALASDQHGGTAITFV